MASSGPNNPTTSEDLIDYSWTWTSPDKATSSDNTYASHWATTKAGIDRTSNTLYVHDFGFSIPSGSTIDGILVEIEKKGTMVRNGHVYDYSLFLVDGSGNVGTTNKAITGTDWPTTETYVSYGGSTDLWGLSFPDVGYVNGSEFGIKMRARITKIAGMGTVKAEIDHVRITVYYTAASSSAIKTIDGLAKASVKTVNELAIASVKTYDGLA